MHITLQYLAWRVLTGRNQSITISFLPTGHTKFSPDWCFGLFKQKFRRSEVGCLDDIARVVNQSASVNKAQLVATTSNDILVPTSDWTGYLAPYFRRIKSIKTYHHILLDNHSEGKISLRETVNSPVTTLTHLRDVAIIPPQHDMPSTIAPKGLPAERQWYLYDKIREYCPEDSKDKTCPLPSVPRPVASSRNTPEPPEVGATIDVPQSQPSKRRRVVCSNCGQLGHNCRSCDN